VGAHSFSSLLVCPRVEVEGLSQHVVFGANRLYDCKMYVFLDKTIYVFNTLLRYSFHSL